MPTSTPSAILRAAQRAGRLTADSLRAAMIDADCEHTSRAHVANLLSGKAAWTAHDLEVAFAHVGTRGLLDTLAEAAGVVVSDVEPVREADLLAEVVHLTADGARLADEVVRAAHPDSEHGRDFGPSERQRILNHADAVRRRLGVVLPMLHATGKRGAA